MRMILLLFGLICLTPCNASQPIQASSVSKTVISTPHKDPAKKKKRKNGRGALIVFGILMLISGFSVLMVNGILVWISVAVAALWWVGLSLIVVGLLMIILASFIKNSAKTK